MLVRLAIRNIVLIERLEIELGAGLTVLTGETGAGKSILLDSLSLALGARGDGGLVRAGCRDGVVSALFQVPADHPSAKIARGLGLAVGADLILRRLQFADGRTRAFVNDEPVSVQTLRDIGAALVEIHGQHDDRALVDASEHRRLVDAFGGLAPKAGRTRAAHEVLRSLRADLAAEEQRLEAARREVAFLDHAYEELNALAPVAGEEAALAERRAAMIQAEKVAGELAGAQELLGGDHSPLLEVMALAKRLGRRSTQAPSLIEPCLGALDAAIEALDRAGQTVEDAVREARYDPRVLEQVEERLFALRAASRKYGAPPDALPALAERFAAERARIQAQESQVAELRRRLPEAAAAYHGAAALLSRGRHAAADRLADAISAELGPLKLEGARLWAKIDSDASLETADGYDRVEFFAQTNKGGRAGPLMKIASGGELARFMLALKVVLADRGSAPTLVFDEIDTGVGGAVADAIGQRLARLSQRAQVLAVTHAPQVAARAAGHFRIAKTTGGESASKGDRSGDAVATVVHPLEADSRREEIARMLAGAIVTDEARAAARRLLEAG